MDPQVLYEDNHLIVVNKPPGMLVHADKTGDITVEEMVREYVRSKYNKPGNVFMRSAHRLDRPVSGAILLGKTSKGHSRMTQLFRERKVEKLYWALTARCPSPEAGIVKQFLVKDSVDNVVKWYSNPVENSRESITEYRVLRELNGMFLIEMNPVTGRSHQLRVMLRSKRCPIAGDVKYNGRVISNPRSILLHARSLSFEHPVKGEPVHIIAPLPDIEEWKGIAP